MYTQKANKNREHEAVTIKIMGNREMLELVLDKLESEFYAVRTSSLMPNSTDEGYHIFLTIVGARAHWGEQTRGFSETKRGVKEENGGEST